MAQTQRLIDELKRYLRSNGVTYAELASRLGLSESSIKRAFSKQSFTLQRLEEICNGVGLELSDLVEFLNAEREFLTELTPQQETALLANPKLLLMTYLLINGWRLEQITEHFAIESAEAERLLIHLHRAKIIELLPFNRFKLLTARNFTWQKDGPVQKFFAEQVQREFLDSAFDDPGEHLRFVGGTLSTTSLAQFQQSIDRLAREFDELSRRDSALPLEQRSGCGAVLAVRPWELSVFKQLRRRSGEGSAATRAGFSE